MGNIKNFNFNKLDLRLSNSEYWDLFLATDEYGDAVPCSGLTSGTCFVVWYDFNNTSIYDSSATSATSIYSLVTWDGAVNTGYTMNTIGLTGIDNGLITFDKLTGDTSNNALLSALTGSTLVIPSGDTRLHLTRVTGTTGNYIYPIDHTIDPSFTYGDYANFCGGFYQGYYKLDGNSYEVLPVRENQGWSAEFWLNPSSTGCTGYTATTLNDTYPENKGLFFYMGTRAENKFWNTFNGVDSGCTSGCTTPSGCTDTLSPWCTLPRESDIALVGDYGFAIPLNPPIINIDLITNPFLIYGRAVSGNTGGCLTCGGSLNGLGTYSVCTYDGNGVPIATHSQDITNTTNPFLIYGRAVSGNTGSCLTCGGPGDGLGTETACSFSGFSKDQTELNYNLDIIDNALGFRIKDDGSIGYRLLTFTGACITASTGTSYVTGVTVDEGYSVSGVVSANTWSYIAIRFVEDYLTDCQLQTHKPRKGKLMIYVNARLKLVVNNVNELVARRLNDNKLKQVGVPYNISLGGGSQGLIESQTFDGLDMADRGLPIETNFAGTFIGGISQFKFNVCDLSFCNIKHNYVLDAIRYGVPDTDLMIDENGFLILQQNGYGIQWT
jgi:hypothetical protein